MPLPTLRLLTALACFLPFATQAQEVEPGQWGERAELLAPNSEFAVAEERGRLYILGGYPADRVTVTTVQVYDIEADEWRMGPDLPAPNNHGMAASVDGKVYLIGGQTDSSGDDSYVDTVYELDPDGGDWVEKAPMPTRRSAGVALVHDGRIYVAGGRPPHGHDFAVYDPAGDRWQTLPDLPSQRNHIAGAVIDGRVHVVGGRLGGGFRSDQTAAHEVFDPNAGEWTVAAPMPQPRSGINGVLADRCLHAWGGESAAGMFPDHDYYDPREDRWTSLDDMPLPVHGRRRHGGRRIERQPAQPGLPAGRVLPVRHGHAAAQSSVLRPGTRANSRALAVTRSALRRRACAAIRRS